MAADLQDKAGACRNIGSIRMCELGGVAKLRLMTKFGHW